MEVRKATYRRFFSLLLLLIILNVGASLLDWKWDMTADKRHSLSNTTKELVQKLDDLAYVKVYLEGDFPAGFIRLQEASRNLLNELRSYSSQIEYEFINPSAANSQEDRNSLYRQLYEQGLEPTNLQVQDKGSNSEQLIFPGAIIYYKGEEVALNFLQNQLGAHPERVLNNSIEQLEYEFTNAFQKLLNTRKPRIAFLEGNGELSEAETADISNSIGAIKGSLSEYYQVERFNLKEFEVDSLTQEPNLAKQLEVMKLFKAIIIAKPSIPFNELDKFLIDQYLMQGGKIVWFVDGVSMDMDSLQGNKAYSLAMPLALNLDDLFFKYGFRINGDLIMDMQSDKIPVITGYQGNSPQQSLFPWFYHPLYIPKNNHPVAKNLDAIRGAFSSTIDSVKSSNIQKEALLFSSPYTKVVKSPHRVSLGILQQEPQMKQYQMGEQLTGLLLTGSFPSVFQNRLSPQSAIPFLSESKPTQQIVFSDGDIIKNHVSKSGQAFPLGYNHFSKEQFHGNKTLIVNALNYITDNKELLSVRGREFQLRKLDPQRIEEERLKWQLINLLSPLLIIGLLAFVWNFIRNRKYQ
jgi:ABC-2 type transport system permease protein